MNRLTTTASLWCPFDDPYRDTDTALRRWVEFLFLYVAMPFVLRFFVSPRLLLPCLWLAGLVVWLALRRAAWPPRPQTPFVWPKFLLRLGIVVLRLLSVAVILVALLAWREPQALFALPRHNPRLWVLIMVFYPLLSVTPQGLIYRTLFEARYAALFGRRPWLSLPAGALVFSLAHLAFRNYWALGFTFVGGLLFLASYRHTRSAVGANAEHALYGILIFTSGWGKYLYHGTQALLRNM